MSDALSALKPKPTDHTANSAYREKLIEHLFVGELMKLSWLYHGCSLEISKPEVDNAGYDIIAETSGCIRHIQIKTTISGGKAAYQNVHTKLAERPSGCVVWIYFDKQTIKLGPFLYFGSEAGKPLSPLDEHKRAKHTKGNKDGFKAERPNIRKIPKRCFQPFDSFEGIFAKLFQIESGSTAEPPSLASSASKLSKQAIGVLPIDLTPEDPDAFKQDFLRSRRATIKITYSDGSTEVKEWRGLKFSKSSNVIGNLRTRPKFRKQNWQASGIVRVAVHVEPANH